MVADATEARDGLPVLASSRHDADSVGKIAQWVRTILADHRNGVHVPRDPGPMAAHSHGDGEVHTHADGTTHSH